MSFAWTPDEYGTLMLSSEDKGESWNLWIQGRRPYCDRGHWEWGYTGVPGKEKTPDVSYYFMRQETAQAELEEWLHRRMKGEAHRKGKIENLSPEQLILQHEASSQLKSNWVIKSEKTLEYHLQYRDQDIVARIKEKKSDTGRYWVLDVENLDIDGSDCFPRNYLILDHAIQETEDFFVWRMLKQAIEIPEPIVGNRRPVTDFLANTLAKKTKRTEDRVEKFEHQRSKMKM